MKTWGFVAVFMFVDTIFYFATPPDYRHQHLASLIPGGGYWVYLKYEAEK